MGFEAHSMRRQKGKSEISGVDAIEEFRNEGVSEIFDKAKDTVLEEEQKEVFAAEHHSSNLYDQDEDRAGELVDLATGRKIDNSTDLGLEGATISLVETRDTEAKRVDEVGIDTNDEAARWLRENT